MSLNHRLLTVFLGALTAMAPYAAQAETQEDAAPADLTGKRVALLVCEGVHDAEALVPLGYLTNRGASVTVVGLVPGYAKAYNSDIRVRIEKSVDEVKPEDFDAVVIPGGKSPACLREHENILEFVRAVTQSGKPTAAVCHGPQVLISAGVLKDKKVTAYSKVADELRAAGALYEDAPLVRDGNIITSRIPEDLPGFCREIELALSRN